MIFELKAHRFFRDFNNRFFDRKLEDVNLEFSSKMKNSAGIFYPPKKLEDFSTIRLNLQMLSVRSDKEVMETLAVRNDVSLIYPHFYFFFAARDDSRIFVLHGKRARNDCKTTR